jgi:hypothetical protein
VDKKPTTAEIVVMASGAAVFIFSFFHFYGGASMWDAIFPYKLVAIFGLVLAGLVALRLFANVNLPGDVGGLSMSTITGWLAFYCAMLMVATLIETTSGTKIGFWIVLLGSIGLLVGTVMLEREPASGGARPGGPGPGPTA